MALFINASIQELNSSLFSSLSGAAAARSVRIASLGRNSGPNSVERNFQQARLDAQAREAVRNVEGYSKLKIKQSRAVKTLEKAGERLVEMKISCSRRAN